MNEVAAIGALPDVGGFSLAGARVYPADTPEQARAAWDALPDAVAVVVLTESAAEALGTDQAVSQRRLTVVMPP
jgi:vacuolar-type H+-ATPase subunit F/Vma7